MYKNKIVLLSALTLPMLAEASGYAVNEQSASGMGNAYAGRAAMAEDASVVFYNPAAMSQLKEGQFSGGFSYLNVNTSFEVESSVNSTGAPLPGGDGGDFVPEAYIPYFYYSTPINDQWSYGVGVFTPFGTKAEYNENFIGAGFADETSLESLDLRVAAAYQVNKELSLGLGLDLITMRGTLSKNVDLVPYNPFVPGLGSPQFLGYENHYQAQGTGTGVGFDFGALYDLGKTQIGFNYRSEVEITLEGKSSFRQNENVVYFGLTPNGTPGLNTIPYVEDQDSEVPLTLPQSATFSVVHQIDNVQLQAGATWTGWSSFEYLDIMGTESSTIGALSALEPTAEQIGHIVEKWEDVWAFAMGASYQLNSQWLLRAGYAYDQSPISQEYRTARVPSTDRQWVTAGARYSFDSKLSVDGAIGYLFMDNTEIDEHNNGLDDQRKVLSLSGSQDPTNLKGEYEFDAVGVSIQINYAL